MKFSFRQILASTAGAVIAAIIASTFGVKGTIVGVAIGSAAATMATAFVAQSIERGHEAVKQVVVRAPETATLLRRLGGTGASGGRSDTHAPLAPTEMVRPGPPGDRTDRHGVDGRPRGRDRGDLCETDAPATERLRPRPGRCHRRSVGRTITWRAIAGTAVIVFVLALLFITAIELISGKPLSTIFGGTDVGTTVKNLFSPGPAPTTTPTSTTTSTTSTDQHVHDRGDVVHTRRRHRPPTTTSTSAHLRQRHHHDVPGPDGHLDHRGDGRPTDVVVGPLRAGGYQPLKLGGTPLHEAGDALLWSRACW